MFRNHQSFLRALLGLMLGVCALTPLRAQLDPRLQNSKTDFLNLYQQSSSLKPKPEIATIFDCSGSMASLMYHPLYQSQDTQDADDYRSMEFQLSGGGTGAAYTNTYTITATDANCPGATSSYVVTVNSATTASGAAGTNPIGCNATACTNAPAITITAYANGDSSAKTTLTFTPTTGANPTYTVGSPTNTGPFTSSSEPNPYTMETASGTNGGSSTPTITYTAYTSSAKTTLATSPYPHGTFFVFTVYMAHQMVLEPAETSADENIDWSTSLVTACNGASAGSISTLTNAPSPATSDSFFTSTASWTLPTWTASSAGTPAQLAPITLASTSNAIAPGATITLVTYFITQGGSSSNITWTAANGSNPCSGVTAAVKPVLSGGTGSTTTAGTTLSSAKTVTWTVPSTYCTGNAAAAPYTVTVTLNVVPTSDTVRMPGVTYLTSALTATTNANGAADPTSALRKPDGSAVMQADAAAASSGPMASPSAPSLAYETHGAADVRNWIRAASHVRFSASVSGVSRTIDIPIPWKVTDPSQTWTNPLTSTTVTDTETETSVVSGAPVTTTYGSSLPIEYDSTYKVENAANAVFASNAVNTSSSGGTLGAGTTTTVYLYGVVYRPAYINWLFTGTYQNTNTTWPAYTTNTALLAGTGTNFVAFDAVHGAIVPNQGAANCNTYPGVNWGAAFGPVGSAWGNISIPQYDTAGNYLGVQTVDASTVATPSLTRLQAIKKAAINTWIAHQGDVYWAFRELDPTNEAVNGSATTITNNSLTTLSASNPTTTHLNGNDSGWTVLNNTTAQGINSTTGNSVTGMKRIAYLFANGQTPLTYALARALAQYEDPNSVFDAVEGANVSQCSNSFLLLFTDGIDNNAANVNNGNTTTPYIQGVNPNQTLSAQSGNDSVITTPTNVDTGGIYWNLYTFAAMAAHLSDSSMGVAGTDYLVQGSPGTGVTSGVPHTFMPFAISQRGNAANSNLTLYSQNHRITTMTVGVSLGGAYTNPASPKANLFYAAVVGDPATTTGAFFDTTTTPPTPKFHTFQPPTGTWPTTGWAGVTQSPATYPPGWTANDWVVNPQDPTDYPTVGTRAKGAVYFFDGEYPAQLQSSMNYAFTIAIGTASNNATSNPDLPFVGSSLGQEVYMGSFQPPITGGVIWPGDLQMFATRTSSTGTVNFLDQNGNLTTTLNSSTAQWTASNAVAARLWSARNLYTRLPATSNAEPGLTSFATSNTNLLPYVATDQTNTNIVKAVIQFAAGGNTATVTAPTPPTANRTNIMGDIIDSAPAAVPYDWSQVSTSFTSRLNTNLPATPSGNAFRLIVVGDNQGWLHGFGETSWSIADPNGDGKTMVTGNVDELWAFMPTDFLANLDYLTSSTNTHRYLVDGSPTIYFLNLPSSSGGPGTGVVESGERAVAICGLGKGGRSYYALDIHNPFTPALLWSLVPDEVAAGHFNTSRNLTTLTNSQLTTLISNMGYSTATPALGRVTYNGVIHDCVFLSGGLSEKEIEANFLTGSSATPLGRSVLALDVYSGQILAAADLSSIGGFWQGNVGAIYAGVVPFEFILNSGYAQRAYFTDYTGGLWAWGSKAVDASAPYVNFREDSAEITTWAIRKVFQDDNSTASGLGARYSTLPAPFLVTNFPGPAYNSQAVPAAVGVAMVSGDRNNPLDENYYTSPTPANIAPIHHDLTVVFDRQDSRALGLDTATGPDTGIKPGIGGANPLLVGLDTAALTATPSNPVTDPWFSVFTLGATDYYLGTSSSPKYGYYVAFPSISSAGFIPKGINPPDLVSNELLYSYFTPTAANPCTGGSGTTSSWVIANVMDPIVNDQRTGQFVPSGLRITWTGVASNYIDVGTTSVLQGGTITGVNASGVAVTTPQINNTPTQPGSRYPKARVWRDLPD